MSLSPGNYYKIIKSEMPDHVRISYFLFTDYSTDTYEFDNMIIPISMVELGLVKIIEATEIEILLWKT